MNRHYYNDGAMADLSSLLVTLQSEVWERAEWAMEELTASTDPAIIPALVSLLNDPKRVVRIRAAGVLRMIGDNRAIPGLVAAITNPVNADTRGSFVYALQTLDCSDLFRFLFQVALDPIYEVRAHALRILQQQRFNLSSVVLDDARECLSRYEATPGLRPDDRSMILQLHELLGQLA